jgi:WD40 repeat protein
LFLHNRAKLRNNRNLISAGSDGFIRLWDTYLGKLLYQFDGTSGRNESIYCLDTNEDNSILVSGDSAGYVSIWDISGLCVESSIHMIDLEKLTEFRAHIKPIVGLAIAEDSNQLITSSTDCSVRLFSVYLSHLILDAG